MTETLELLITAGVFLFVGFQAGWMVRKISQQKQLVLRQPVLRETPLTRQEARRKEAKARPPVLHTSEQRNTIRRHLTEDRKAIVE